MNNSVLIVGGEGYIGSVLSSYLISQGFQVKSLDSLIYNNHSCVLNNYGNDQYEFIFGDMKNKTVIEGALKDIDYVVLLAGLVGDPITKKYPQKAKEINDYGVKTVIDACKNKKIKKLIFVSTCSNYGLIKDNDLADENHELKPLSLYAESKVRAEKYILSQKDKVDYDAVILRFATAFGLSPRMRFDLTISQFTRELYLGNELIVFDENTWRPYCHTLDFSRLIHKVIQAPSKNIYYEIFNAGGSSNNFTKQMIVDEILKFLPNGKVKYQKNGSDPRNYRVDFSKVNSILGFEPKYNINFGIKELIEALDNQIFELVNINKNFYGNYEL
tara:strand:+ start:31709 stop:32698 length:990 start_codon:yes stop_codon:yes gene_type:complete